MTSRIRFVHRLGLWRSVLMYHAIPLRRRRLTRFYAQFIRPGDLCFDIGAHVGSRLRAWTPLGARILAVEPQPECMALLRRWYGDLAHITLIEQAVGRFVRHGIGLHQDRCRLVDQADQPAVLFVDDVYAGNEVVVPGDQAHDAASSEQIYSQHTTAAAAWSAWS